MISHRKWTQLFALIVVNCQFLCYLGHQNNPGNTSSQSANHGVNTSKKPYSYGTPKSHSVPSKPVTDSNPIINQSAVTEGIRAGSLPPTSVTVTDPASFPCPEECYCDRTQNPLSLGLPLSTTDCSNLDLKKIPQVSEAENLNQRRIYFDLFTLYLFATNQLFSFRFGTKNSKHITSFCGYLPLYY